MSKVITTVTEYENKALEVIVKVQDEVLGYVKQVVEFVDGRIPEVDLPFELPELTVLDEVPTISEVVDTQFAFSKKLLANQEKFAKNVVKAVKPLTREGAKPKAKTTKAATAA
jgi:hypothetical protein